MVAAGRKGGTVMPNAVQATGRLLRRRGISHMATVQAVSIIPPPGLAALAALSDLGFDVGFRSARCPAKTSVLQRRRKITIKDLACRQLRAQLKSFRRPQDDLANRTVASALMG